MHSLPSTTVVGRACVKLNDRLTVGFSHLALRWISEVIMYHFLSVFAYSFSYSCSHSVCKCRLSQDETTCGGKRECVCVCVCVCGGRRGNRKWEGGTHPSSHVCQTKNIHFCDAHMTSLYWQMIPPLTYARDICMFLEAICLCLSPFLVYMYEQSKNHISLIKQA